MKKSIESVIALNDLICINNERYACYKKAAEEMNDANIDLKGLFNQYAIDARIYANKLQTIGATVFFGEEDECIAEGSIYREWKNALPVFDTIDRQGIVIVFNGIEHITQSAYESVMAYAQDFSDDMLDVLEDQQFELNESLKINAKGRMLQSV